MQILSVHRLQARIDQLLWHNQSLVVRGPRRRLQWRHHLLINRQLLAQLRKVQSRYLSTISLFLLALVTRVVWIRAATCG